MHLSSTQDIDEAREADVSGTANPAEEQAGLPAEKAP